MKVNFSQKLANLDGSTSDEAPTLGDVSVKALVENLRGDEVASGEDKFKRAVLAQKILPGGEIELPVEELATVKDRIGKACHPVVVLAAWNLLENTGSLGA
ncbi:hypothetical protein [Rhizobium lusitanum]|uniref:Uncharacterized protein n=1 Tax=Rhizobium lusitanum TaxID=293958 RepID=A0A1C3USY9_9HYPH|nr:hypothetical protein [Rhizobium lusitanum]SCB18581.1 hypothetical protein GA0061101_103281 [Rhizobium lusitanum]